MEVDKYLGIDIGGTNIKLCTLDAKDNIVEEESYPTRGNRPYRDVLNEIIEKYRQTQKSQQGIKAIGIGICGPTDFKQGLLITSPILKNWQNVPIRRIFSEELKIPVVVDNDANLAIYGESVFGAGKGLCTIVGFTLGTGVGGGIVIDGQLLRGSHFFGGELGHMTVNTNGIQCNCGNRGCLTIEASSDRVSSIFLDETGTKESVKRIFELAWNKDEHALRAIDPFVESMATGIANVLNIFDPDCVILTGGITKSGENLLNVINVRVRAKVFSELFEHSRIFLAKLGEFSGAIGAAVLARESVKKVSHGSQR